LRWIERARFTGEPLIALLYLFFALEALLGDKPEGLKADDLAFGSGLGRANQYQEPAFAEACRSAN
jgi:hypothetical protein